MLLLYHGDIVVVQISDCNLPPYGTGYELLNVAYVTQRLLDELESGPVPE